ncbi:transcriptional regulator [Herbaspirillum sp. CF444]|uniref:LysR family transcriptional regulator n=1 Tax=Herbaspirillum sp. CF444 TaxID=1144319 RepID=UPI00027279B8|nr:LysR family transcriptional regulator [Herbaspirillum sp. CF444]EJL81853.1 transcriptional regulator [Herbaspirillum sp. CF444]
MNKINTETMDLNLIRVFLAIWDTKSLTDAGERLCLTQSAVSHALKRLRAEFDDPLFVRDGNSMVPTSSATQLQAPLRQAIGIINNAVMEYTAFDPMRTNRVFRIAMSDVSEYYYLPQLLAELERTAPLVQLEVVRLDIHSVGASLYTGDVDLAVGYLPGLKSECVNKPLLTDTFVCLVRAGHPLADRALTRANFTDLRYIYVGTEATGHQMVEHWLDESGILRKTALRLGHFTMAPEIVRQTDLAVIYPRSIAERVNRLQEFVLLELPFETPSIEVKVHTHLHFASDMGIQWLSRMLAEKISLAAAA